MRQRGRIVPLEDDSVKIYKGLRAFAHACTKGKGFVIFTDSTDIKLSRFPIEILGSADTHSPDSKRLYNTPHEI